MVGMDPTVSNAGAVSKPRSHSPCQLVSLTWEGSAKAELVEEKGREKHLTSTFAYCTCC